VLFKAVIFDLDGTLIDSMGVWERIDCEFLKIRGLEVPSDYAESIATCGFTEAAAYTVQRFNLTQTTEEVIDEWYKMALKEYSENIKLKPFVKEYIQQLYELDVKMGVATVSPPKLVHPVLKQNGIADFFDVVVTMEDVKRGKEFPDIYLHAALKLRTLPEECLVFEDVPVAMYSAKRAGMKVWGVYDDKMARNTEREDFLDGFIKDFSEAPRPGSLTGMIDRGRSSISGDN